MLANARLCVIALTTGVASAGQIRLMTAATVGVPAIVTDVPGIDGYQQLAWSVVPPSPTVTVIG